MSKNNENSIFVEENGLKKKIKTVYDKCVTAVKNFFYDISYNIHNKWVKVFGKKQKSMKSGNVGAAVFAYTLIAYPMLQFLIFYVYVNFNSILLALQEFIPETATFEFLKGNIFGNFKDVIVDIIHDSTMKYCVSNSLVAWAIGLIVGFPLNLTFAYVIYKKVPAHGFFQVVLFLPQILSSIVMSMMFSKFVTNAVPTIMQSILSQEQIFDMFGIEFFPDLLHHPDTIFGTMVFYSLWSGFGSQLILYSGAMSRIPDSIIEYGELEGITLMKEFWYVCIPMIWSTITIFLVTGVAGIFSNQLALYNFYGTDASISSRTLGYHFFIMVLSEESSYFDYPYASAAGLLFSLVATPITLLARHLLEKYGPNVEF